MLSQEPQKYPYKNYKYPKKNYKHKQKNLKKLQKKIQIKITKKITNKKICNINETTLMNEYHTMFLKYCIQWSSLTILKNFGGVYLTSNLFALTVSIMMLKLFYPVVRISLQLQNLLIRVKVHYGGEFLFRWI